MAQDALLAALKSIADENGLERIDLGYASYSRDRPAYVSIWWSHAGSKLNGHTTGGADNFDDAIAAALAAKSAPLAPVEEVA